MRVPRNITGVVFFSALIVLGVSSCHLVAPSLSAQEPIDRANRAFAQFNYMGAIDGYHEVWAKRDGSAENRIVAAQRLAYLAWRVRGDYETAKKWSGRALALEPSRADTWVLTAAIERESGRFDLARTAAAKALNGSPKERRDAINESAMAAVKESLEHLKAGKEIDRESLRVEHDRVTEFANKNPEDLHIAERRMELSLLLSDWDGVLSGWKAYFRISSGIPAGEYLGFVNRRLESVVNTLNAREEVTAKQSTKLISVLGESRLFSLATLAGHRFGFSSGKGSPEIRRVLAYARYLKRAEEFTFDYYRELAQGMGSWSETLARLNNEAREAWPELATRSKSKKDFSVSQFNSVTRELFGAYRTVGIVNGQRAFYVAHSISEAPHRIEQYGKSAEIQVITLDKTYSSDFSGWFLNTERVGGSARKSKYLVHRFSLLSDLAETWLIVSGNTERDRLEKQMKRMTQSDLDIARKNGYAFLPGLGMKMKLRLFTGIYDDLVKAGFKGNDLKLRYLNALETMANETMVIHEGRHVIDLNLGKKLKGTEMEYRAKLSELAFAKDPTSNFVLSVYRANLGVSSTHGQAQKRIVRNLVDWMEKNSSTIDGFKTDLPAIYQLELLTDDHFRTFARSIDPLAKKTKRL